MVVKTVCFSQKNSLFFSSVWVVTDQRGSFQNLISLDNLTVLFAIGNNFLTIGVRGHFLYIESF